MGMIVAGIFSAIVIAIGASYLLRASDQGVPAWQIYSTSSVRVDDPGQNLVGPAWTGDAEVSAAQTTVTEDEEEPSV